MQMNKYNKSINAYISNANSLLDDGKMLYEMDRFNSAQLLVLLAQEESAKAFLLNLIEEKVIPWTKEVEKSLKDHKCKHLIGELMYYLNPSLDIVLERSKIALKNFKPKPLPDHIADIIDYYRHEKIGRWISPNWWWDENPNYDKNIKKIAKGKVEKEKQDATYCKVTKEGQSYLSKISKVRVEESIQRTEQMLEIADGKLVLSFREYERIKQGFKIVFGDLFDKYK